MGVLSPMVLNPSSQCKFAVVWHTLSIILHHCWFKLIYPIVNGVANIPQVKEKLSQSEPPPTFDL